MKISKINLSILALVLLSARCAYCEEPSDTPRPIPLTRPELKRLIEDVKVRTPRIPLPELTDKDREQLGDRADNYESRLRYHFLAGGDQSNRARSTLGGGGSGGPVSRQGFNRVQDSKMTLPNSFKVELFWIVSRTNNCQYCLGHQESKLLAAGLSEDRIASLDGDWRNFSPSERAAYTFARKYTYQPHLLEDADITALKKHFNEDQILEMMLSMAGNNSINRWKEGVGVPQNVGEGGYSRAETADTTGSKPDQHRLPRGTYLTPTSDAFASQITSVAPIVADPATGKPSSTVRCNRPELESRSEVEQQLQQCRHRESRLALVEDTTTQKLFALDSQSIQKVPNWMRLLANYPTDGVRRGQSFLEADRNADLDPRLKAQISWILARYDRAWYAVNESRGRLLAQGVTEEEIYKLDGDWTNFTPREQALFVVARNLGASPVVLTDRQVENAVALAGAASVVQTINYVTHRAAFNRLTEAAGLPIE